MESLRNGDNWTQRKAEKDRFQMTWVSSLGDRIMLALLGKRNIYYDRKNLIWF